MTNLKITATVATAVLLSFSAFSCNKNKSTKETAVESTAMNNNEMAKTGAESSSAKQIVADYMTLKNALVATNKEDAAKAGLAIGASLNSFDMSKYTAPQQKDLKDIIADAKENAEHISESEIDHQREHFKILTKDITDMIAITGADSKVYQMNCPMYDGGSNWLSESKEVKNPYLGSKMMTCGSMKKELN
ncbi:Protein of unknown function [Halpernia humi]|uniref:DUF3347 domain-containing protein n=1 Tax=Halpernia humi TaxID=493375 RepID=A0A1H5WZK7_9FLAO|nr:DUF3347 domain-containing protein [Halpernia humi]SEG04477.1 Protein of unknown function [Halpernia humi]